VRDDVDQPARRRTAGSLRAEARAAGEAVQARVAGAGLELAHPPHGTNVLVAPCTTAPDALQAAARAEGIEVLPPSSGQLVIMVNETWIGPPPEEIAERLGQLLRAALARA